MRALQKAGEDEQCPSDLVACTDSNPAVDQALAELITMTKAESVDRYTHAEWFFPVRQVLVQLKGSPRDRD